MNAGFLTHMFPDVRAWLLSQLMVDAFDLGHDPVRIPVGIQVDPAGPTAPHHLAIWFRQTGLPTS